jgi:hypothetical protein
MFKRRPLGNTDLSKPASQGPVASQSSPGSQNKQAPAPGGAQLSGPPKRRNRNRGRKRPPNQGAPGCLPSSSGPRGSTSNPSVPQNQARRSPQRQPQRERKVFAPQKFPEYLQRDLLLMVESSELLKGIDEVRLKFDPLAKKIPPHVTLLYPEHEQIVSREFLKKIAIEELPSLQTLTFSSLNVHDGMYLWLMADVESKERLKIWHDALVAKIEVHTQEDTYDPHLNLGYIPRSLTTDEAMAFARNLIKLPLTLTFQKILLEQFSENQNSVVVDSYTIVK